MCRGPSLHGSELIGFSSGGFRSMWCFTVLIFPTCLSHIYVHYSNIWLISCLQFAKMILVPSRSNFFCFFRCPGLQVWSVSTEESSDCRWLFTSHRQSYRSYSRFWSRIVLRQFPMDFSALLDYVIFKIVYGGSDGYSMFIWFLIWGNLSRVSAYVRGQYI